VCVYSLRAKKERPYVSMPLQWEEVERGLEKDDPLVFQFDPEEAIKRCEELGDLFDPVLTLKQKLPAKLVQALLDVQPAEKKPSRSGSRDLSLAAYKAKRDFTRTQEPPPRSAPDPKQDQQRLFVIQKHAASRLHYDFRLEMGGALKSWAVPKGPPYERNEKRLAMQVEDHPLEYARFEGTIPPGNYGAGTVMVWDIGQYEVMDGNLHAGKLHMRLNGKKLKGEWILVQARRDPENDRTWFLIKGGTTMKRLSARRDDTSVLTGRSMKQIGKANDAQWISNRPAENKTPKTVRRRMPARR
jgi:bifunctional non-homologous end joining protein LigD